MKRKTAIEKVIAKLGRMRFCAPIDIFATSRAIAELKDQEYLNEIVAKYGLHPNAFVKRCVLIAIRYSSEYLASAPKEHAAYISSMLLDENHWVQYDACWLIKDHGFMATTDPETLKGIAGELLSLNTGQLEELSTQTAQEHASKMAAEAIVAQGGWSLPT